MPKTEVWIVEDDKGCQFVYNEILNKHYETKMFSNIADFKNTWLSRNPKPRLIIADLCLPDQSFLRFLAETEHDSLFDTPFIVVSSTDDADTLRYCFEEGALDYIVKPFGKAELLVKVERLLSQGPTKNKSFTIDPHLQTVTMFSGDRIQLTPRELQILITLQRQKTGKIKRSVLIKAVWGDVSVSSKTLDVHIFHLRKKIFEAGFRIQFSSPDYFSLLWNGVVQKGAV